MIRLAMIIFTVVLNLAASAQGKEFKVYSNGLIYSEPTMKKLSSIVDSLNLKYKTCDLNKTFYSVEQVIGHLVTLDTGLIKNAKNDLEQNISYEDFCKKYPEAKIKKNVLILRRKYSNYHKEEIVEIEHFDLKSSYGFSIESTDLSVLEKDFKNTWLYQVKDKSKYNEEKLTAFYFPENFQSIKLPQKYSLMIGYSDCLIDTNSTKLNEKLDRNTYGLPENWQKLPLAKKEALLEEMRRTQVVGFCSQDDSPRWHAVNIALLSAEIAKWEVFLKAHLDIMNDRFERMSDGSYAYGKRNTYIRELEELNINVSDLIFGITFRMKNAATNHYYGSISRLGRALSETKNREVVERSIISIISDEELDDYNRLLFYFLFKNYLYYLSDEKIKQESTTKLDVALKTLPEYFNQELTKK